MPDRLGNAALIWSATSDASGQRVHLLQVPLRAIKAGHSMETFQRQSLDRSVLENVAIGDGSAELRGRVRYDHDPVGLSDAIVAGSQGKTLRYIPDLTDPDMDFQCDLVAPLAPFGLELDQQRGILGDQSVELVLRQTDQGSFDPLYHGSAVLFSYRAGGSLEASSSFGRVTSSSAPATFATLSTDGGGFGTLSTALSNQARIHWMAEQSSVGPRTFPTLLLEGARTNRIIESEDFGLWTNTLATLTSGQVDPYGGTKAWLLADNSTSNVAFISLNMTLGTTDEHGISVFLRQGTISSTEGVRILFSNLTAGTNLAQVDVTFSNSVPTMATPSPGSSFADPELWRGDWWRIMLLANGSSNAADTHQLRFDTATAAVGNTGNVFLFGAQVE